MATVRLKKVKHIMTIGSDKYSFLAPDIYSTFGSSLGITKAPTGNDPTVYTGKISSDDFANGTVIKIKARGNVTANGVVTESKDFSFEVPLEKAKSALAAIESKTITISGKTYDLGSARIPQRVRFS
jgi:hypothetical protein